MELIVAIMFFSLAAAVCVRLFTSAHLMAEGTENLSNAVMWSQNLSEVFEGNHGDIDDIAVLYPEAYVTKEKNTEGDGILILFFDSNWNLTKKDLAEASYEGILDINTLSASEVYSDVTDYGVDLVGNAAVGEIAIMDLRGAKDVFSEIPDSSEKIILQNKVDVYLGKEGN